MHLDLLLTPDQVIGEARPVRRPTRSPDALLIAALAAIISGAAASRPSLWFDEAATISASANRSLAELWQLLRDVDAVHGLYYLLMHGWFAVFPATEFWSRLPSCLAVGAGAAGVVVLVKQFCARRVAVCAGVLFAVLPRMTWAGIEARSYAFSALAAVWLTVLCVAAVRRGTVRTWFGYGVLAVVAILLNPFAALVVVAHTAVIGVLAGGRSAARRWAVAASAVLAASAPFLLFSQTQIRQVGWISPLNWHTAIEIVQQQYFDKSVPFTMLAGIVIASAAAVLVAGVRQLADETRQLLIICTAWILAPTVITLIYSAVGTPVYYPRYLICTAPAMAILLAICVTTIAAKPSGVVALVVLFAAAAAPNYLVTQRDRHAKEGWDYSQVADVVQAQASPGDCLLVDNTTAWAPGPIRALPAARPAAFAGLVDPGRGPRGPRLGRLWDGHLGVWAVADRLNQCNTIWTITNHDRTLPARQSGTGLPPGPVFARSPDGQVLHRLGFRVVERWQFTFSQVIKSAR
ncbi:MAG TPA: glycosyltransferase family 39 protein [Mycobacterium sp.]|nr:glycosyltransferase family 39 protein [Mycobacterium sp.]